jgi:anti-sigma B factor antagonist
MVIAVAGELDLATAPALRAAVADALDAGAEQLWIDLRATQFMDSSGIHLLVETERELGRRLVIVCPPGPVRRVLDIAGVADALPLRHSPPRRLVTASATEG